MGNGVRCRGARTGRLRAELSLFFDAAHALGCSHRRRPIGGFGAAEVFSFHATKVASAGEGGAITTNDAELAHRLRLMRNFGFAGYDTITELGTNGKMSELAAAFGITSLESLGEFIAANRRNYIRYVRDLDGIPGIELRRYDEAEQSNYHYIVIEVSPGEAAGRVRDELAAVLHAENVLARRYFSPGCHRAPPYFQDSDEARAPLARTEDLCSRVLALPTGTAVGEAEIDSICSILRVVVENAGELHERLTGSGLPL